jgi:hypothetical protein
MNTTVQSTPTTDATSTERATAATAEQAVADLYSGNAAANRKSWFSKRFAQHGMTLYAIAYLVCLTTSIVGH